MLDEVLRIVETLPNQVNLQHREQRGKGAVNTGARVRPSVVEEASEKTFSGRGILSSARGQGLLGAGPACQLIPCGMALGSSVRIRLYKEGLAELEGHRANPRKKDQTKIIPPGEEDRGMSTNRKSSVVGSCFSSSRAMFIFLFSPPQLHCVVALSLVMYAFLLEYGHLRPHTNKTSNPWESSSSFPQISPKPSSSPRPPSSSTNHYPK